MTISPPVALLGSQRPRASKTPPYSSTAGDDAIALAASAGLILDPWQQYVLRESLGERVDGKWSAFEVGLIVPRQNGKGTVLEARELYGLFICHEERLIIHSAHLFKTSKEAFRRIMTLIEDTPDLGRQVKRVTYTRGDEGIELKNGSRLAFVARSKGGGRGLSGDCLILDEAFALTDEQMEALMPVMAARPNGQIWYASSPPLDAVTGDVLFGVKARGEKGEESLAWFDWGQPPGVDMDDPAVWAASNPALGIRISIESVARERRSMSTEGFGRERLGIWPEAAGVSVISPELWAELADPEAGRPSEVAFAVDVTPMRDHAAIAMAGFRSDGLVQVAIVDHRAGTDWIAGRLADLKARFGPVAIAMDGKGPVATLARDFNLAGLTESDDPERPMRGDLAILSTSSATTAFGMVVDAARQRRVRHSDDAPLNVALAGAKTRPLGDGSAWARRGNTDISPLVATTLAHWALVTLADAVKADAAPSAYWL